MKEKRKKFFVSMDQFNAIQKILDTLHQKVGFDSVLLADHSGQLISRTGELSRSDAVSVTALAAGSFRANQEIAKVIGDSEFTHITQEGSGRRIYISCMDSRFFLISVFGEGIALGLVRIMQKKTENELLDILNTEAEEPAADMKQKMGDDFDDLLNQSLSDVLDF